MREPALLFTLDKKVKSKIVNENKGCIGNDSLKIFVPRLYHIVGGLGSCPKVWDLGFCLNVRGLESTRKPGSGVLMEGPARGSEGWCPTQGPGVRSPIFLVYRFMV